MQKFFVFEDFAVIYFGHFPVLFVYSFDGTLLYDFPLPSSITTGCQIPTGIAFGFQNGSICFFDGINRTLKNHIFPKQGMIQEVHYIEPNLITFTSNKIVTSYLIDNFKVAYTNFTFADEDIMNGMPTSKHFLTFNQKSSDINLWNALHSSSDWEERKIVLLSNYFNYYPSKGTYIGSLNAPNTINLKLS